MKYSLKELKDSCKKHFDDFNGGYMLALKDENIITYNQYDELYKIMTEEQKKNDKRIKGLL